MEQLYSEEAEIAVISSCLMDKEAIEIALNIINTNDFYDEVHYNIFKAIVALHERKTIPDLVTVTAYLRDKKMLDTVGGSAYIASFIKVNISTQNVVHYAKIMRDKAIRRHFMEVLQEAHNKIENVDNIEELMSRTEDNIMKITFEQNENKVEKINSIVVRVMKIIEKKAAENAKLLGLPTRLYDLDRKLLGLQDKQLIIIGGRPSKGKSSLGLNIASFLSLYKDIPIAFFSLEDSKERIVNRILSIQSRVDSERVRLGAMNEDEWSAVAQVAAELHTAPLYIADNTYLSRHELSRTARKIKKQHGIKILFVDYLQLMTGEKDANREREISSISQSLKAIAKDLSIPVVAMAQLNRVSIAHSGRPKLSDFRESGAIEQDADVALLLWRPNMEKDLQEDKEVISVIIAKQKDGGTGEVQLMFNKKCLRFDNYDSNVIEE